MSIVAEFSAAADEIALGGALSAHPEVRVELEKVVPTRMEMLPFFWAWGGDLDAFSETVRDQPVVSELRLVDSIDDQRLYRVEWEQAMSELGRIIRRADATVLEASGRRSRWQFELRFHDHEDVRTFQSDCAEHDLSLDLKRLHSLTELNANGKHDLTPEQRDTLLTALDHGYFEEPRGITLQELADVLELSPTAVSGRMRRGQAKLVARSLVTDI